MKYIASCSFGKDSIATILLALENNEPLDGATFSEVMFSHEEKISGEIPEHIEWIYSTAIPKLRNLGVHVEVVRSQKDYVSYFSQQIVRGKRKGMYRGFPLGGRCLVNHDCKIKPIHDYYKSLNSEITQYVGIAADEKKRLERISGNKISLLAKYGFTEAMALEKAKEYDLLSPIYDFSCRGGCWFCPNVKLRDYANFKRKHPDLWDRLYELGKTENLCSYGFKYGKTIEFVNRQIDAINNQLTLSLLTDKE